MRTASALKETPSYSLAARSKDEVIPAGTKVVCISNWGDRFDLEVGKVYTLTRAFRVARFLDGIKVEGDTLGYIHSAKRFALVQDFEEWVASVDNQVEYEKWN